MGDLTLIGTGSEWFWTMVSGLVVAVTFVVIYRQLKAQGAANAFKRIETVHGRWGSPELVLARLQVALALRDGTLDADDTRVDAVLNFFELVRDLNRQGYLEDEEIARSFGAFIVVWWRMLEPVIREQASLEGDPEMWIGLQELEGTVRAYDTKRGVDRAFVRTMPLERAPWQRDPARDTTVSNWLVTRLRASSRRSPSTSRDRFLTPKSPLAKADAPTPTLLSLARLPGSMPWR